MSTMAEALKRVGLATQQDVERVSKENRLKSVQEPEKRPPLPPTQATSKPESRFTKLFNDEKSQKFMIHVLHAFTPFAKGHYVFDWEMQELKAKPCDICRCQTISKVEALALNHQHSDEWEKSGKNFFDFLQEKRELFSNKKLAASSAESKTIMCAPCHKDFMEWVVSEVLGGNRLVNKILHKQALAQFGQVQDTDLADFRKREEEQLKADLAKMKGN